MTAPLRVVVADDQAIVREGLVTLLGIRPTIDVVGEARDGHEAVALAASAAPDVVLMDLRMPRCDGVEATRRIRAEHPAVEVVVLTTYADDDSILGALRAGARGYLTKDAGTAEIERAVQAAAAGQSLLDPEVQRRLLAATGPDAGSSTSGAPSPAAEPAAPPAPGTGSPARAGDPSGPPALGRDGAGSAAERPDGLTAREAEVLVLIAAGRSNAEIAAELVVSAATIKTHVNRVFAKTGARDRAQAVHYAYEHGLAGG